MGYWAHSISKSKCRGWSGLNDQFGTCIPEWPQFKEIGVWRPFFIGKTAI